MSLNFIVGLLLVLAVLAVLVFILKELLSDWRPTMNLSDALGRQRQTGATEAKPVNAHMIGMTGEVVGNSEDDERPMKVRISSELWPARGETAEAHRLPVGTHIAVTAVDGPVVTVRPTDGDDAELGGADRGSNSG